MSESELKKEGRLIRDLEIKNELGLHARAASALANLSNRFSSNIELTKDGLVVNGKSIMGILMLAAPKGSVVTVSAEGADAGDALRAITDLVEAKFGEK